jgi:PAS domain S-box-containing protein
LFAAGIGEKNVFISSTVYIDGEKDARVYLFVRDITTLKKKENLLAYLNIIAEELALARDTNSALDKISKLIVPKFANWFSIDLLRNGKLEELILAHEDPEKISWAKTYRETYPVDLNSDQGAAKVLKTGIPSHVPVITADMVRASITDPVQLDTILKMNLQSVITVAISGKSGIIGAINFVSTKDGQFYDETDLRFAQSFASHIGLALENARLNEAAQNEIMQRKLIELKLNITQTHLQSALSSGLVGTWVRDLEKNLLFADESLSAMFGIPYNSQGLDPEILQNLIHPDDQALVNKKRRQAIKGESIYEAEYRVETKDGIKWFFVRGKTELNADGKPVLLSGVMIDITSKKEAELALEENEKLFRFLTNAIPHKLWTSGPDGRATYYNQGWYDYTGIHGFNELREQIWDILHPDDREKARIAWPKAMLTGEETEMEHRFRRHDGQYRWHLSRYSAHKDDEGNIKLWVGTSTDIHEQKENEQRKDEFLSIASHELKTPLTSIKAFNQLMKRTKDEERLNNFIEKSSEHIYRLEKLINDLLDVTKINSGKMNYSFEAFDFEKMLVDSIENMQYNTSHEIILESAPEIIYNGDPFRLEQVMNNLLSFAIKYSPQGQKIVVNSNVEYDNIVVSIQDFGIGIAPENLDRLFDRYYRVDNTAMRFDGLGLGLFISSEILKRHQGSFWIESELDKGSTFYFRLPINTTNNTSPLIKTDDFYQDNNLSIKYNEAHKRLEVNWTGFQDMESVQKGCMMMLEYLKKHHCNRIVNDNTNVLGSWSEAADWVGNIWFPMMEEAGLTYFAHIFSPSTFSQLSAKKSIDIMNGIITTQYFTDVKLAEEWIDSCSI